MVIKSLSTILIVLKYYRDLNFILKDKSIQVDRDKDCGKLAKLKELVESALNVHCPGFDVK